ncbi:G-type lectin S-receptor-like serine/threonine-protein kinase RKS1 [Vitis vinifera]|uniref:G-type lectin S-receptor-like serine/threonine-protein kinase RKS1 n=1 Tax=Vitis vinifera TaxID=29760 RepID=A0A438HPG6_VITVI|nr:G-type lectin S-receptor-like serine/threonine-protein kinase RKS1 [Vitis vinifera]
MVQDSPGAKERDESTTNSELQFFDLNTIVAATNNFSSENELGRGGFGSVYKGQLYNGQEIAVKKLSKDSGQGKEEFKNEARLLQNSTRESCEAFGLLHYRRREDVSL